MMRRCAAGEGVQDGLLGLAPSGGAGGGGRPWQCFLFCGCVCIFSFAFAFSDFKVVISFVTVFSDLRLCFLHCVCFVFFYFGCVLHFPATVVHRLEQSRAGQTAKPVIHIRKGTISDKRKTSQ